MTDDVTLTEAEREELAQLFGYVPEPEPLEQLLAAVERIIAAREAGLRDDVERLARWKAEALPVIAGLQGLGRALGLRLGEQTTGPRAVEVAEALVAERDRLSERVKSVRALADSEEARLIAFGYPRPWEIPMLSNYLGGIKAAIAALDQDGGE